MGEGSVINPDLCQSPVVQFVTSKEKESEEQSAFVYFSFTLGNKEDIHPLRTPRKAFNSVTSEFLNFGSLKVQLPSHYPG